MMMSAGMCTAAVRQVEVGEAWHVPELLHGFICAMLVECQ